jgi:DnaB helicase-like protein
VPEGPLFAIYEPPANVAAEMALLGALLHNNKALEMCGPLMAQDFADDGLGNVFAAIQEGVRLGRIVDAVSLKGRFPQPLLASLLAAMVAIQTAKEYARVIVECARRRKVIEGARELAESAFAGLPPDDIAAKAQMLIDRTQADADGLELLRLDPVGPAKIPPRRWAYGHFLLFGCASVIGAVDGGGKGAIAVVIALAMITGKPLLGEHVWRAGPVVIITY